MFLLGTWKYVSVKLVQSYAVFHALSNGVLFTESARSQKFDPVDMQTIKINQITMAFMILTNVRLKSIFFFPFLIMCHQ